MRKSEVLVWYSVVGREPERAAGQALVRSALSRCADVAPSDWRFEKGRNGRPRIVRAPGTPPLDFNLSHSGGVVACAVALGRKVGLDVEDLKRSGVQGDTLADYLAPHEIEDLRGASDEVRDERFLHYWTLKEAYAKARSLGLELPFSQVGFDLEPALRVRFAPGFRDDPSRWRFWQQRIASQHLLAVAVRAEPDERLEISVRLQPE